MANHGFDKIDLPDDNREQVGTYGRDGLSIRNEFIDNRNKSPGWCELTWVDNKQDYPFANTDIADALRLTSDTGIMLCEDVHRLRNSLREKPHQASSAAVEILAELRNAELINFNLMYKRTSRIYCVPKPKHCLLNSRLRVSALDSGLISIGG